MKDILSWKTTLMEKEFYGESFRLKTTFVGRPPSMETNLYGRQLYLEDYLVKLPQMEEDIRQMATLDGRQPQMKNDI